MSTTIQSGCSVRGAAVGFLSFLAIGIAGCPPQTVVGPPDPFFPTAGLPPMPVNIPPPIIILSPGPIYSNGPDALDVSQVRIQFIQHGPIQAGGQLGGDRQQSFSPVQLDINGTGSLAGYHHTLTLPITVVVDAATRPYGAPVQSFCTDAFMVDGQVTGDPDFDLLRITGGTSFGMPSPGHTTLRQQGPNWDVDSFFDITYRIDFVGAPGGPLAGLSGSTTRTQRLQIGLPQGYRAIVPGDDLWHAMDPSSVELGGSSPIPEIPADFFEPGSEPFSGEVEIGGLPIDSPFGNTDTIVERMSCADMPTDGSSAIVPIHIVGLNLVSVDPIVVHGQRYHMTVSLGPSVGPGSMDIHRTDGAGGTFSSTLPVAPLLRFQNVNGGPVLTWPPSPPTINLNSLSPGSWSATAPPIYPQGGGADFFPAGVCLLQGPGMTLSLKPARSWQLPYSCLRLDMNFDRKINGDDVAKMVEVLLAGPSHPQACQVDLNRDGILDSLDIAIAETPLLFWADVIESEAHFIDEWPIDCDYRRDVIWPSWDDAGSSLKFAIRAADSQGHPSTCSVFFQLRTGEGVDIGNPTPVAPGATKCVDLPGNRELVVWCEPITSGACRISYKVVKECP